MLFHQDLEQAGMVCPNCGHHMRIGAEARFTLLLDEGSRVDLEMPETPVDPLKFRDRKRYTDRLKEAGQKNGPGDALKAAAGTIEGAPAVIAVLDFAFMGGSMGATVGAGFVAAVRAAIERQAGFIAVTASGGARMQEGILSLMQMPRTVAALGLLKDAKLPYVVLLTDPTTGGVSASFAMLGDVAIAEPGAGIGFAGQRVIKETIGQTLPEGFQRAEYLHEHGMIDMVVERREMKETLGRILSLLTEPMVEPKPIPDLPPAEPEAEPEAEAEAEATEPDAPEEAVVEELEPTPTASPEVAPEADAKS
jgi:acetyl-CoA carboxylase carboxyl transferase subunit beta